MENISRRRFLKLVGAGITLAALGEPAYAEQSSERRYTTEDIFVAPLSEYSDTYPPNTNLKKIIAIDRDQDQKNPIFTMTVPIGTNYKIGKGMELVHESWFENDQFQLDEWLQQVLIPIWNMHDASVENGILLPDNTQELRAHTGPHPTGLIRPLKILCLSYQARCKMLWGVHNLINEQNHQKTEEENFSHRIDLASVLHEWFHEFEYKQLPHELVGSEAFATAYMIEAGRKLGLINSSHEEAYRDTLADLFYSNTSLEMKPHAKDKALAGYEHVPFIEWLMEEEGIEWSEMLDRLKNLPCNVLQIAPSNPFPVIFSESTWPDAYGLYLAEVLVLKRENKPDPRFDPLRERLGENISSIDKDSVHSLDPDCFSFHLYNLSNDPDRQHYIKADGQVFFSTPDNSFNPTKVKQHTPLSLYINPPFGGLLLAAVNTGDESSTFSIERYPLGYKIDKVYLPSLGARGVSNPHQ